MPGKSKLDYCDFRVLYDPLNQKDRLKDRFYKTMKRHWKENPFLTHTLKMEDFDTFFKSNVFIDRLLFKGLIPMDTSNKKMGIAYMVPTNYVPEKKASTRKKYEKEKQKKSRLTKFKNGVVYAVYNQAFYGKDEDILNVYKPILPKDVIPGLDKLKRKQRVDNVCIMIGVHDYMQDVNTIHDNHMISAFKHHDTLYCFNAWGKHSPKTDNLIWINIKRRYGCKNIVTYTGWNFQQSDRDDKGTCTGFSTNFGALMYIYILLFNLWMTKGVQLPEIPKTEGPRFNAFVEKLFKNFRAVFGQAYMNQNPIKSARIIYHNMKQKKRILKPRRPKPIDPMNIDPVPKKRKQPNKNMFPIRKPKTPTKRRRVVKNNTGPMNTNN